jgi:2-polyprenyl-3-methyl-5-hydroxy-6-metoxy-1,4-benzoquinol methylase
MTLRNLVKPSLPEQMRFIALFVWKCLRPYNEMDNTDFWKGRSKEHGQKAVLWKNEDYNNLMRKIQREKLDPVLSKLNKNAHVLDVGCGIGIVTAMMLEINPSILIDSLDFPEMIKKARMLYKNTERVNWIASSAESYLESNRYDLIVSSGAYSAIRDDIKRLRAMENAVKMLKPWGCLFMIDPWHRWRALSRARMNSQDVIRFMRKRGLNLIIKSGIFFWPTRILLANSTQLPKEQIERVFRGGERLLKMSGSHFWADYKILEFRKEPVC